MGVPLNRIGDIRHFFNQDKQGDSPIDFHNLALRRPPRGHVIATRITAENADEGFTPSKGSIQELNFRSSKNVWGYFSVSANSSLHEFADSQFGHVFSWGETREEARQNAVVSLKQLSIRADFRTPVDFLIKMCETPDFAQNACDTAWLDGLIAQKVKADKMDTMLAVICCAVHVAAEDIEKVTLDYHRALSRGHVPDIRHFAPRRVTVDLVSEGIKYSLTAMKSAPGCFILIMNDSFIELDMHVLSDGGRLIVVGGNSFATYMREEVDKYRITIDGKTSVFEKENDPSLLRTNSPGKLVRYLVDNGEHVRAGAPYAEIEVMKMYLSLMTTEAGTIQHLKPQGVVLEAGDPIAKLVLDDPAKIRKVEIFSGSFPGKYDEGTYLNFDFFP